MPGNQYESELRFIDGEVRRLSMELTELKESMPSDPRAASAKVEQVLKLEDEIGNLLTRKREIEDSLSDPDVCFDIRQPDSPLFTKETPNAIVKPESTLDELAKEIESITDELMGIEIKMLRADMNGDESEKQKLTMMTSSLRARRDTLVEQVKELRAEAQKPYQTASSSEDVSLLENRIRELEMENQAIRSQMENLATELGNVKEVLMQIIDALGLRK